MAGAVLLSGGVAALSVARAAGAPAGSFGSFAAWPAERADRFGGHRFGP